MDRENPKRCSRVVTVHLEPELHDKIKEIARRDGRPISNMIRKLAEDRVRHERATLESPA